MISAHRCVLFVEGTTSQLVDAASGIHPRYERYYVRRIRISKRDPLYRFMRDAGVPCEDDVMNPEETGIFSFPQRSPDSARLREHVSALEQLELWKCYQDYWCEHKPSMTCYVRDDEWTAVKEWVWTNFDCISGLSFLPYDNGTYKQAPYESCTREEYERRVAQMPAVDWSRLANYDRASGTTAGNKGGFSYACAGDACSLVDIIRSEQ